MSNTVIFKDLGLIPYKQAWDLQTELHQKAIQIKRSNRHLTKDDPQYVNPKHYLLFCEHPAVYTLGRKGSKDNLLLKEEQLDEQGFEYYKINRGGDITYHGPGQLVVYPILDLDFFFTDVHRYVRYLEEIIIRMLDEYNIKADREKGYTGVWLKNSTMQPKRKICAIGVHLSRWVTMHGLALNVNPNLTHFNHIVPCGINETDKTVTSMQKEIREVVMMEEVKAKLVHHFEHLFECQLVAEDAAVSLSRL